MENQTMEDKLFDAWCAVHNYLGLLIFIDIENMKRKIINKDSLKRKIESMSDSLISKVEKNKSKDERNEEFMSYYNTDPQLHRELIIKEYTSEYNRRFPILCDFYDEMKSHKKNVILVLEKLQTRKNKSKEELDAIRFIREYSKTILPKDESFSR
jgi:hypothetical protein